MRYVSIMVAALIIPLSFWWTFQLREPGFVKAAKHERTPFWKDMKRTASNRNFVMLTLTIFTLAMGFNFVQLLGSYIPIFYVFGGDKVAGAYLLGINGTIWAITGLLAVFPLNWISPKLGKRNTLTISILLMCLAQLSKIVCYNPSFPYLLIIPTVLLSAGMLFFFTLGSSMVGDICDEDELKTGYRAEGSYYSIFWWFIKMGTAFASFVAGALIVLTAFDEIQVTKVDSLSGIIREIRSEIQSWGGIRLSAAPTRSCSGKPKRRSLKRSMRPKNMRATWKRNLQNSRSRPSNRLTEYQNRQRDTSAECVIHDKSHRRRTGTSCRLRLENLGSQAQDSQVKATVAEAIPLTLQTKFEKARMYSFELMSHLESKSKESKNSVAHYQEIIQNITTLNDRLASLNAASSLHDPGRGTCRHRKGHSSADQTSALYSVDDAGGRDRAASAVEHLFHLLSPPLLID